MFIALLFAVNILKNHLSVFSLPPTLLPPTPTTPLLSPAPTTHLLSPAPTTPFRSQNIFLYISICPFSPRLPPSNYSLSLRPFAPSFLSVRNEEPSSASRRHDPPITAPCRATSIE